jgi:chromosome segregation protein
MVSQKLNNDQLEQKVEWLDAERRTALDTIADLEKRLAVLEKAANKEGASSKAIGGHTTRIDNLAKQLEELEKKLKTFQTDSKTELQNLEKLNKQQEKTVGQDQKGLSKVLDDFRKEIGQLQALQKSANQHDEQIESLTGSLKLLKESVQAVISGEQNRAQLARSLEEASKEDARRLTEMRGEVLSLLTRLESAAKQTEGILLSQRKVDKRMDEVAAAEKERQVEHDAAMQKIALAETDREHRWKDWDKRFASVEQLAGDVVQRLKEFDKTEVALKRAETAFNELVEKINRRVNELGEIQRLGDQRFRQEWSTFQADSQKRWSAFTLSHEEQQREGARQRGKLADQVAQLEENLSELKESLQHLTDQSERNLQTLLEMARDSLSEHQRFLSNSR